MQSAKEAASNVAASAKAGMDKTKAVVGEKAEKMTTRDPLKKQMAEEKKEARIHEAERMKQETRAQNEAAKHTHGHGLMGSTTDYATGTRTSTGGGDPAYGVAPEGFTTGGTGGATRTDVGAQHPTGTGTGLTGTGLTGGRRDPRT